MTDFGAFFDPLADKILCLTLLWTIAFYYVTPLYVGLAIIFSFYDITTTTMRLRSPTMSTSKIAKYKTALLMSGITLLLVGSASHASEPIKDFAVAAGTLFLLASAFAAIISLRRYMTVGQPSSTPRPEHHRRIGDIDFKAWRADGVTCVLFDIEGTLTEWADGKVTRESIEGINKAKTEGMVVGLVTNMHSRHEARVRRVAEQVGAKTYHFPRSFADKKPGPRMIRAALKRLDMLPNHAAFVGDKLVDVIAGKRAGVAKIAWVTRLGDTDHGFDRLLYRRIEPLFKRFFR